MEKNDLEHDEKLFLVFEYLKQLEQSKQEEQEYRKRTSIGFKQTKKK